MSLGFIAKWRGQPLRLGPPIPRAPLVCQQRPAGLLRSRRHLHSETPAKVVANGTKNQNVGTKAPSRNIDPNPESYDRHDTPEFDDLTWAAASRSAFVKPTKQLPDARETHNSQREHHKYVMKQIRVSKEDERLQTQPTDWGKIHDWLFSMTPVQPLDWIENGMKITLSRFAVREMLQDAGDFTIAAIRRRTKTTITIPADDPVHTTEPSTEDVAAESTLFVSGSRQAINRAVDQVRRTAGRITITRLYSPLEPGEKESETYEKPQNELLGKTQSRFFNDALRSVKPLASPLTRAEGAHSLRRWIDHHVKLISLPSEWTVTTFENYIKEVVDSAVLHHLHAEIYPVSKEELLMDHQKAVAHRLLELFNIAPAILVASCSALKIALLYLCTKGPKFFPKALKLVKIMESRLFRLDTQVYNTLLLPYVAAAHPQIFFRVLKRMKRQGYRPDLETWLLFLRMTQSREHKSIILSSLRSKNLLDSPEALQSLAAEMAADDAEDAIAEGKDLRAFNADQTERYGPGWLTRAAGMAAVDVFCSYKRFEDAFLLLDLMITISSSIPREHAHQKLGTAAGAAAFNKILVHARHINKMALAVNVQRKLAQSNAIGKHFDPTALDLLFEIAWKSRLRSSVVVIWRYACLARTTSWRMRQRVADLLQGKVSYGEFAIGKSVYRALGGEVLARELVGGRKALAQVRKLAMAMAGSSSNNGPLDQSLYRAKLAALAAQAIPLAFGGRAAAVEPGEVLTQSVLVDMKCLQAEKEGTLGELLSTTTVKKIPLVKHDSVKSRVWIDFPRESCVFVRSVEKSSPMSTPKYIMPGDVWDDRWDSQGWTLGGKGLGAQREKQNRGVAVLLDWSSMPIIDPKVWADEAQDVDSQVKANRTKDQIRDEELMLDALSELAHQWTQKKQMKSSKHQDINAASQTAAEETSLEAQTMDELDQELGFETDALRDVALQGTITTTEPTTFCQDEKDVDEIVMTPSEFLSMYHSIDVRSKKGMVGEQDETEEAQVSSGVVESKRDTH